MRRASTIKPRRGRSLVAFAALKEGASDYPSYSCVGVVLHVEVYCLRRSLAPPSSLKSGSHNADLLLTPSMGFRLPTTAASSLAIRANRTGILRRRADVRGRHAAPRGLAARGDRKSV